MASLLRAEIVLTTTVRLLSQHSPVSIEEIAQASSVNSLFVEELLRSLGVEVEGGLVKTSVNTLLLQAWRAGYDILSLALNSRWSTLEELVAQALREAGFTTFRTVRFKYMGKRFEVDVLAIKTGIALCIDCKRWQRLRESLLFRAAEAQTARCEALAKALERSTAQIDVPAGDYLMIPVVISLYKPSTVLHEKSVITDLKGLSQLASEETIAQLSLSDLQPTRFHIRSNPRLF